MRSILIILLAGLLVWLILRLSRTMKDFMPGEPRKKPSPLGNKKIIDAEFEDVAEEDVTKES
ncbi:MAG: hypothetical protein JSU77_05175 [Fidelibacterota bacterium]|nr:MAG: hypothetical protein JSU77_05175 [Candidatus Neomarinimicrobiota bacterium]